MGDMYWPSKVGAVIICYYWLYHIAHHYMGPRIMTWVNNEMEISFNTNTLLGLPHCTLHIIIVLEILWVQDMLQLTFSSNFRLSFHHFQATKVPKWPRSLTSCRDDQLYIEISDPTWGNSPHVMPQRYRAVGQNEGSKMYDHIYNISLCIIIKGSWEAILPSYGQIEFWDLKWLRVVCHLTIHNKRIRGYAVDLDEGW